MSYSGDAAEQVVRMSLEGAEVAARITGQGAKEVAILLYAVLKDQQKTMGKTRLTSMLRSEIERAKASRSEEKDVPERTQPERSKQLQNKQSEYNDLKCETIKVIRGESSISMDLLNEIIQENEESLNTLKAEVLDAEGKQLALEESSLSVKREYDQLLTWADIYDQCSMEAKKMIVAQLIQEVRVGKGYQIEIGFNISFEDFQRTVRVSETGSESIAKVSC